MHDEPPLNTIKRKLKVEQTVREFLNLMDENELNLEEGLIAWNMLGFTMFQDQDPDASYQEIQKHMIGYSEQIFYSKKIP